MKIIKQGNLPSPPKPYWIDVEIKCSKCNTIWTLDETDTGPHVLRQEGMNGIPKVECPNCKNRVVVPGTLISRVLNSNAISGEKS